MNNTAPPAVACLTLIVTSMILSLAHAAEESGWDWRIASSQMDQSKLTIVKQNTNIASYYLECDLSLANLGEQDVVRVNKVITSDRPNGIVITICNVGAHSKLLSILDPGVNCKEEVFSVVGAYMADWSLDEEKLIIEYDTSCIKSDAQCDDSGFKTITRAWPVL